MDKIQLYTMLWLFSHLFGQITFQGEPLKSKKLYAVKVFTFLPILGRLFGWW